MKTKSQLLIVDLIDITSQLRECKSFAEKNNYDKVLIKLDDYQFYTDQLLSIALELNNEIENQNRIIKLLQFEVTITEQLINTINTPRKNESKNNTTEQA
jgi:hypothetical protein